MPSNPALRAVDVWTFGAGRALREALESFASAAVTSDILTHALSDAGFQTPPDRPDELAEFADGALRTEITAVLGAEVADAVVDGLGPIIAMMRRDASSSGVVRKKRPSASEQPSVSVELDARARRSEKSTPPRPSPRAPAPARNDAPAQHEAPPRAQAPRPATVSQLGLPAVGARSLRIDVAIASDDVELVAEAATRVTNCRMTIVDATSTIPFARVVLLDTRRSLAALRTTWERSNAPETLVLWPAGVRERQLVEVLQPNVRTIVCVGDEADAIDVLALVAMHAGA